MNQQRSLETATGVRCILGGAGARVTLLFLLHWRKINICLTVADHCKIEWISSGSQISSVSLLIAQRLDPKADVPPRHGPSGWRVQAELSVGVRVKFRGWRSDEGQGYGQVGVTVRSKYPTPLGQHFSGHCLPLRPVREMSSEKLQLQVICINMQHSHWHEIHWQLFW